MPRRPPPTALLLHPGPTPPRSRPKHTLPSLPRPTFYPASYPSKTSLPHPSAVSRAPSPDLGLSMTAIPGVTSPTASPQTNANPGGSSPVAWLWSWLPGSDPSPNWSQSSSKNRSSSGSHTSRVRGPWDHSRSLSESTLDVNSLIKAPKPAAVTTSPLLSNVW